MEMGSKNVTVNAVSPGATDTDMFARLLAQHPEYKVIGDSAPAVRPARHPAGSRRRRDLPG
jgi:NAD(P)-dependent dehydrogenase (short-subunit alcohol dehydrogenase family)